MFAIPNDQIPTESRTLPRFFAVILLSLAALLGLPTALASIGSLAAGDWRSLAVLAGVGPIVYGLIWLGMLLWSGRSIPSWFITAFLVAMVAIPVLATLSTGDWKGAAQILAMWAPAIFTVGQALRPAPEAKPLVPKEFDDFA